MYQDASATAHLPIPSQVLQEVLLLQSPALNEAPQKGLQRAQSMPLLLLTNKESANLTHDQIYDCKGNDRCTATQTLEVDPAQSDLHEIRMALASSAASCCPQTTPEARETPPGRLRHRLGPQGLCTVTRTAIMSAAAPM